MRELKFRYTCRRSSGHVFSQVFTLEEIQAGFIAQWMESNIISFSQISIQQFTGFKDANAADIYEGDLYKGDIGDDVYQVFFKHGCWFGGKTLEKSAPLFMAIEDGVLEYAIPDWVTVVGYIYANPELINQTL